MARKDNTHSLLLYFFHFIGWRIALFHTPQQYSKMINYLKKVDYEKKEIIISGDFIPSDFRTVFQLQQHIDNCFNTRLARLTPADSRKFCLRLLGCQPGCTDSILFVQKMRAFRRLVLECFHKQKITKITVNFPQIIELHLNSSSQCIQLAMRQVN